MWHLTKLVQRPQRPQARQLSRSLRPFRSRLRSAPSNRSQLLDKRLEFLGFHDILRNRIRRARSCRHIKAKQNLCFCSIVFLVFIVLIQSHNVYRPEAAEGSAMRVSPLPREYSPGMPLGLVAVSASRSRPYLQAAGGGSGRQTATCLLVSFGLGRTDGLARGVPVVAVRAKDRHPDGPRPAAPGLGSAGRRSLIPQQSLYRGLGPGRGPFGRGAPKLLGHMDFGANGRLGGGN